MNGGQAVNGTNCGIGGIGINGNGSDDLKRAAYIFAIWSTSRGTQYNVLKGWAARRPASRCCRSRRSRRRASGRPRCRTR